MTSTKNGAVAAINHYDMFVLNSNTVYPNNGNKLRFYFNKVINVIVFVI